MKRVSLGSALARVALGAAARAAREILGVGRFTAFAEAIPYRDLNALMRGPA